MKNEKTKNWKEFRNKIEREELEDDEILAESNSQHEEALERPSISSLEEKLTLAEQEAHNNWLEAEKYREMAARASAELQNYKVRSENELRKAHLFGQTKLINDLLPVLDSLEQALQLAKKNPDDGMYEGLELTQKLLMDAFSKQSMQEIDPLNQPFNPLEHEAMSIIEDANSPDNSVVNVFQKGYKIADRVIRPARVIIARNNS